MPNRATKVILSEKEQEGPMPVLPSEPPEENARSAWMN